MHSAAGQETAQQHGLDGDRADKVVSTVLQAQRSTQGTTSTAVAGGQRSVQADARQQLLLFAVGSPRTTEHLYCTHCAGNTICAWQQFTDVTPDNSTTRRTERGA
jgi:hypothetical protein